MEAEHPLFLLYTSSSTGKPKGVVHATGASAGQPALCRQLPLPCCCLALPLSACLTSRATAPGFQLPGGFMVFVGTTTKYVFAVHPQDVFWCTADCGWVTGHSYVTYGGWAGGCEWASGQGWRWAWLEPSCKAARCLHVALLGTGYRCFAAAYMSQPHPTR